MNGAVAAATAALHTYGGMNPSPLYYVHAIGPGIAIIVRRYAQTAPVVWCECELYSEEGTIAFQRFIHGYSPVQLPPTASLLGRIRLDDYWG
jgi:hypothetical protein